MVRAAPALVERLKFSGGIGREFNIAHHKSQSFFVRSRRIPASPALVRVRILRFVTRCTSILTARRWKCLSAASSFVVSLCS